MPRLEDATLPTRPEFHPTRWITINGNAYARDQDTVMVTGIWAQNQGPDHAGWSELIADETYRMGLLMILEFLDEIPAP